MTSNDEIRQDPDVVNMEKRDSSVEDSEEHTSFEESDGDSSDDDSNKPKSPASKIIVCILVFFLGLLGIALALPAATLLIVPLIVARLSQFTSCGDGLNKAIQLEYFIKSWIAMAMNVFLLSMALFFPIAKYTPGLKHVMLVGLPLTNWIIIACMMCGMYILGHYVSIYAHRFLPRIQMECNDSGIRVPESISEIINCLIIWWAVSEVKKRVPAFKQHQTLGLYTSEWIKVTLFALIGYNCITLSTCALVSLLRRACRALHGPQTTKTKTRSVQFDKLLHREHVVYCANGIRSCINFILTSMMLLLIWVLYFGSSSHLDKTPEAKRALYIGTQTFVSLLVCSFLRLLKRCTVLAWEAGKVYNRLRPRIQDIGKQLHFLRLLGCATRYHRLQNYDDDGDGHDAPKHDDGVDADADGDADVPTKQSRILAISSFMASLVPTPDLNDRDQDHVEQYQGDAVDRPNKEDNIFMKGYFYMRLASRRTRSKRSVKDDFCMPKGWKPTLYDIQQTAQYLIASAKHDALEDDRYASHILDYLKTNHLSGNDYDRVKIEDLQKVVKDEKYSGNVAHDWEYFAEMVTKVNGDLAPDSSKEIPLESIQIWMETTRKNCLFLANTISGDMEIVDCLRKIINWLIIGATFIMWLLLTKLASTKVLVLILSPLLAASFIFGDTCKNLFQGIMFVYVLNPFAVGDECDVGEDLKMRVISIGVWKTTFSKDENDSQVKVIYPNSELATKRVINRKIKFDWLGKQRTVRKDGSKWRKSSKKF